MSLQEYLINTGVPDSSFLGLSLFLININDLLNEVTCNTVIYADDGTLYSKPDWILICGNSQR